MNERNNDEKIMKMINIAASALGMTPEELSNAAKNNDTDALLSKVSKDKADKIRKMVDNGQAQDLINKYLK